MLDQIRCKHGFQCRGVVDMTAWLFMAVGDKVKVDYLVLAFLIPRLFAQLSQAGRSELLNDGFSN